MKYYLAIDIGASNGRGIVGYKENGVLITDEVFRFKNGVQESDGHLIWDIENLYNNVILTIREAIKKYGTIESMSIDTWGVDYVIIDNDNKEVWPCYAYRDKRDKDVIDEVHSIIPFDRLYEITGSQFQEFNTVYQLYWDNKNGRLKNAKTFLQIPCYLMYKLTGVMAHEYTNCSTTGMMDGDTLSYSEEIINKLGLPKNIFMDIKKPGYILGDLKEEVQNQVKGNIKVKLCSTHDTGAAVEGMGINGIIPYISSGTWSLLGIKSEKIIRSKEAKEANYSNEYGPDYIRFQKNIMGMWIAQQLRKETGIDFVPMAEFAADSTYEEIFDPNDNRFLSSLNMKEEIKSYFRERNIKEPETYNDIFRSMYLSLAHSYNDALNELEKISGYKFDSLYIVGGGAKNKYLNAATERITGRKVIANAIEATSIGNLLGQMEE